MKVLRSLSCGVEWNNKNGKKKWSFALHENEKFMLDLGFFWIWKEIKEFLDESEKKVVWIIIL